MILLIGAGKMSQDYVKVLEDIGCEYEVVCRSENSAKNFKMITGKNCFFGGISNIPKSILNSVQSAIVAVNVESIHEACKELLDLGIVRILLEKPGSLYTEEFIYLDEVARRKNAKILIGYNRRFYASTAKAKEIIEQDGGVKNFYFEMTEWGHVIQSLDNVSDEVKSNWFLANTTHLVDLAFYLGGKPKTLNCNASGTSDWHQSSMVFSGSGITKSEALFSYIGNWQGPGRFRLDVITNNYRLIFAPIEKLKIQKRGEIKEVDIEIDDKLDLDFKPGLAKQVSKFIKLQDDDFCTLKEQLEMLPYYKKIANYA